MVLIKTNQTPLILERGLVEKSTRHKGLIYFDLFYCIQSVSDVMSIQGRCIHIAYTTHMPIAYCKNTIKHNFASAA